MYRPSQTPHPTLSSARIASQNKFPTERKKLKATERTKTPAETETPAHPAAPPRTPARTAQASTQESSQTRQSTPRGRTTATGLCEEQRHHTRATRLSRQRLHVKF